MISTVLVKSYRQDGKIRHRLSQTFTALKAWSQR